jgi:hypothetical protein
VCHAGERVRLWLIGLIRHVEKCEGGRRWAEKKTEGVGVRFALLPLQKFSVWKFWVS